MPGAAETGHGQRQPSASAGTERVALLRPLCSGGVADPPQPPLRGGVTAGRRCSRRARGCWQQLLWERSSRGQRGEKAKAGNGWSCDSFCQEIDKSVGLALPLAPHPTQKSSREAGGAGSWWLCSETPTQLSLLKSEASKHLKIAIGRPSLTPESSSSPAEQTGLQPKVCPSPAGPSVRRGGSRHSGRAVGRAAPGADPPEMKADVCDFFSYLTAVMCLSWPSVSGHFKLQIPRENNQKMLLMVYLLTV